MRALTPRAPGDSGLMGDSIEKKNYYWISLAAVLCADNPILLAVFFLLYRTKKERQRKNEKTLDPGLPLFFLVGQETVKMRAEHRKDLLAIQSAYFPSREVPADHPLRER